ncbi:MAG: VOC family protein [Cyanobacteria bacterium]|nr:VOC family protein [Cyanobacteriota bacterium]
MNILQFNHIGINVKNFQESFHFYKNILNLKFQKTVKMPDCTITYFLLDNGQRIELFDYYGNNQIIEREESSAGYRHIAIEVDDIEKWEKYLKEKNVPIILSSTYIQELGVKVLLFKDPNDVILEFCKPI